MSAPRKFDHDHAREMYQRGISASEIARRFEVTGTAVSVVVNDEYRAKQRLYRARYQREKRPYIGVCPDCGGPAANRFRRNGRCHACTTKRRTTSVRSDTLQCCYCHQWLPDEAFSPKRLARRRDRSPECKPCGAAYMRAHRERKRMETKP